MQKINLICLPYAGGNAYSYNEFRKFLEGYITMVTPELAGRGQYLGEQLPEDLYSMADDIFEKIRPVLHEPYAFYGHSMGGFLGFLVARKIKEAGLPNALHFFCSGCEAPSTPCSDEFHKLSNPEFIDKLRDYGGSSEDILNNKEIMDFLLPIIRADFKAFETFQYQEGNKLDFPITVMISDEDDVSLKEAQDWQMETNHKATVLRFPGDHFFILKNTFEVCAIIQERLKISK